jgi:hypothetical protein
VGLHAQIHQKDSEVSIALTGEFQAPEYDQLAAIVKHFRNRGCRHFVLDLRGIARMNSATEASLRRLVEEPRTLASQERQNISAPSAFRRITPQSGRRRAAGGLFSELEVTEF